MTRKIVRWMGKILSPIPNTVTSDLGCCCGCLCCSLTRVTFELGPPTTPFQGIKVWGSYVGVDYDCYYDNEIPENNTGSAYALYISLINGVWDFTISLYCYNTYETTPSLVIDQNNVTEVNNYPSGEVSFVGIGDPNLDEKYPPSTYVCKIKIKFVSNKAFVSFTRASP